jgi:act minimal PKS acyl carrier protein
MQQMTVPDLMAILARAGGVDESVDLGDDISHTELEALGYESLAVLEAAGLIEREYDVTLDEAALSDARTPQELLAVVHAAMASTSA